MADPVWVDGTTLLNSVNMTKLQTRDERNAASGYVGLDGSSRIVLGGDTYLYRLTTAFLKTDGSFRIDNYLDIDTGSGGAQLRFGSSVDTNLYRAAAGVLKTDGSLRVLNYLDVDFGGAGAQLRFGSAVDTNLYRAAAGTLKTDGQFFATGQLVSNLGTSSVIQLSAGQVIFNSDTNLYRSVAGVVKTDGTFHASTLGSGPFAVGATDSGGTGYRMLRVPN